jgi:hypothetical protein
MNFDDWCMVGIVSALSLFLIGIMYGLSGCNQLNQNPAAWCADICGKAGIESFVIEKDSSSCNCKE